MKSSTFGLLLSLPGLIFIALLLVFPISLLFTISFLRYDFIHPVTFIGLNNYIEVVNSRVFWISIINAAIYSSGVTAVTTLLGVIIASSVSRIKKLSTLFRTLFILPWAVPLVVSGLVWRWMLDPGVGVYNYLLRKLSLIETPINIFGDPVVAMIGVIMADSWTKIPLMFVLVLAGIKSIPPELYEAAKVDGASSIDTFRYVTLPLIKKSILFGVLVTSMFSFRTIDAIWSMTRGGPGRATYVIGQYLVEYVTQYYNLGFAAAVGVILMFAVSSFAGVIVYYLLRGR